jgi:hypothetical protein
LNVVIVRFAYPPHPGVRRAVLGNPEIKGLEDDPLSFQDFFARVRVPSQGGELLDSRGKRFLILGSDEDGGDTNQLEFGDGHNAFREEAIDDVDGDPDSFGHHVVTEVDLQKPVDQRLAHFPGKVVLSIHILGVWHEAVLNKGPSQRMWGRTVSQETYFEFTHVL